MSTDSSNASQPSSQAPSVIDGLANIKDGDVALQQFFIKRPEGLFVDLSKLDSAESFQIAADRAFSVNTYFTELDYELFAKLLYDFDPANALALLKNTSQATPTLCFAQDIVAFRPERRALYREVKVANGEAEYYFEPVYLEKIIEEPVYEDGVIVRIARKTVLEPASLTFDEFVADMWSKGIHFGIDVRAVRAAIDSGKTARIVIARRQEVILGKAADIQEIADEIHRDDAPKMLADGRVDLSQFQNRFPQIKKGARLLKKIPPVLGITGHELSGNAVEPPLPKDINLGSMAGTGTAVEMDGEMEFIVSQQDGFLSLDPQTKQISIIEKIISREGVSARTTGNLILEGDEFEGYGEVQEKRLVEGNNITIHANVYGTISSRGGNILLTRNLVGGMATNQNGDIIVEGISSSATLQTKQGGIFLKRAENCVIIGTRVVIESASNCDILADEVTITMAEGCAVVARGVTIDKAGPHKQNEMLIFALVPSTGKFDREIEELTTKLDEIETAVKMKNGEIERFSQQPEIRNYLTIGAKLRKNEIVLTPEQQANFQKLTISVGPTLRLVAIYKSEIATLQGEKVTISAQVAELKVRRKEAEAGIFCSIADVTGETVVRTMPPGPSLDSIRNVPASSLKSKLRRLTTSGEYLFTGRSGSLDWVFTSPD